MDTGWVGGWESQVKDCLQQSKILNFDYFQKIVNFFSYVKFKIENGKDLH